MDGNDKHEIGKYETSKNKMSKYGYLIIFWRVASIAI